MGDRGQAEQHSEQKEQAAIKSGFLTSGCACKSKACGQGLVCAIFLGCLIFGSQPERARAQTVQRLPDAAQPGRPAETAAPILSLEDFSFSIELPAGVKPPPGMASETLDLTAIRLEGNSVFSDADLQALFADYSGRQITFAELYEIPDLIRRHYHKDGYALTFAFFPPQEVANGVYKLQIVEGYVDEIIVRAEDETLRRKIQDRLAPITRTRPFRMSVAESRLLRANDLPGIKVSGMLQPSKRARGASELVATVEHKWVEGSLTVENRNSAYTGPWASTATFGVNSPFGMGGKLSGQAMMAGTGKELKSGSLTWTQPVGDQGTTVAATGGYAAVAPGKELDVLEVEGRSWFAGVSASHPLIRSREENLSVSGGLTVMHADTDILDTKLHRDRVRTLQASLNYSREGFLGGSSVVTLEITQGLPVLNASDKGDGDMSRSDARADFTRFRVDAAHLQPLGWNFSLYATAAGQISTRPVLAAQEFTLGGAQIGRGYDGGEIAGDHGIGTSVELQHDIHVREPWLNRIQLYGFYDFGAVWDNDPSVKDQRTLASTGAGVRAATDFGLAAYIEYAKPLTRPPATADNRQEEHRIYFGVNARY